MPRFRARPAEIEATRWTGGNYAELVAVVSTAVTVQPDGAASFMTVAGTMFVPLGSWLVRGQTRGLAVMADGEFTAAYEPADDV